MTLDYLQIRKHCKTIMDDLLQLTPMKKSHIAKLDLLKALLKNGLKISPKSVTFLEKSYNILKILYSLRIGECVLNCHKVG